jgi:hypothetical protein
MDHSSAWFSVIWHALEDADQLRKSSCSTQACSGNEHNSYKQEQVRRSAA